LYFCALKKRQKHQINNLNSLKMKKLVLTLGLASLFMVACNNTPKQPEQAAEPVQEEKTEVVEEKHDCPMHALKEEYAKWDEMTDEAKAELNKKACAVFTEMDAKMEEMKAAGEGCAKEMAEMTEEQKAECEKKCAEMKAAWEKFGEMTVDEQKDLIMQRLGGCEGEKDCCKGEGHQCQHDAQ
jgi:hypothetical protein